MTQPDEKKPEASKSQEAETEQKLYSEDWDEGDFEDDDDDYPERSKKSGKRFHQRNKIRDRWDDD